MIDPLSLGALSSVQNLLMQLVESLPARDCSRRFDDELPSAAWLLGRAVYLELHLLRGGVMSDHDLASRVQNLFADAEPAATIDAQLPPQDHLLNWASEIFDQHLTWLANPGQLPPHPWLDQSWLVWHLAQRLGVVYEQMLAGMTARSAHRERGEFRVGNVLTPQLPCDDSCRIEQGHYRIGAREGAVMPNEQPAQVVELNAYRINRRPVNNAEYLAFISDGGYRDDAWWDDDGIAWRAGQRAQAPWQWRRDAQGDWFEIGVNGAMDLHAQAPVTGLSAYEARAFAAWAAARGDGLSGAVPQHEYQWEVAARLGELHETGRSWEWCANSFHTYPAYEQPAEPALEPCAGDDTRIMLRGGCLHSQPSIRRSTFRYCAAPDRRTLFAGLRLVMPPGKAAWE